MTRPLRLSSPDDGAIPTAAAEAGTELCGVRLRQPVPSAKIALRAIPAGAVIRKYGQPIGIANATLAKSMADDIDVDSSAALEGNVARRTRRDDFQAVAYGRVGRARQVRESGRRRLRIRVLAARRLALITGKEMI